MARVSRRSRRSTASLQRVATLSLLALAAAVPVAQASVHDHHAGHSPSAAAHASSSSLNPTASIAKVMQRTRRPWFTVAKDQVFNTVSRFLSHALPDPRYFSYDLDQFDDYHLDEFHLASSDRSSLDSDGVLDGPGLNWGGSTLEVVRSQAIFLTRSAAFGPHVTDDAGLKGFLLPITDFYKIPKDASFSTSDASRDPVHACPYKGGPGSHRDVAFSKYEDEDDRRLYSSFHSDKSSQTAFTWTHEAENDLDVTKPPHNWIALVERGGGCGFADKVRVAQQLGAVAVVVGDSPSPNWHGGRTGDPNEEGDPGLSGKRLITMFAPGDTSDVRIPSTFVTRPSYLDLERLIEETEKDQKEWERQHSSERDGERAPLTRGLEIVIGKDDLAWEWPLIDFGILLLLLPSFMTVITIIVHRIRMVRQRRKERAPELVVLGLPCLIWRGNGQPWEKVEDTDVDPGPGNGSSSSNPYPADDLEANPAGETIPLLADQAEAGPSTAKPVNPASLPPGRTYFSTDECAICLCDFVDGDRVRVLPCGHIFHRQEVDDWLVRVKKLCPICKRDITVPVPPGPPVGVVESGSSPALNGVAVATTVVDADTGEPAAVQQDVDADVSVDLAQHLSSDDGPGHQDGRQV
ncbi:Zinc finger, RING-type [Kalmanozyma brasiliensis GHG001]|uniref:RING-type domain-containing protein n=1 Tax=Kalmanozyma brasiliensis (strain GHG001) TaxID=1365824 RepID=V5ET37_KALBG|nr:Zinc finger, RING-type [Kalmanozyma brasiliensis GHG001]EST06173.1 Zinc finger, RING-type [Kalmanozyma brasiliensis GHG001]